MTNTRRILLTGFPPFPGRPINPTQQLVEAIRLQQVSIPVGLNVHAALVPCAYRDVETEFQSLVEQFEPDLVLACGVGHSGALLHLEQQGLNLDDAQVPDNAGETRNRQVIIPGGPETLPATIDVIALHRELDAAGVSVTLSNSAGRYLCNHLLYFGLHLARQHPRPYKMTFVHVRPLDRTGGENEVSFETLVQAMEILLHRLTALGE
ncbi:MAG: pyroglutamyl-peptidase I [Planctomycetaceae bacterium]|nr:pyroglutamyl-peptidase I [Planctomycetaceae bacterium]